MHHQHIKRNNRSEPSKRGGPAWPGTPVALVSARGLYHRYRCSRGCKYTFLPVRELVVHITTDGVVLAASR